MVGTGRGSKPASRTITPARSMLSVVTLLATSFFLLDPAQALPLYARQTGQQCAACHNGFPELTPYGRLFKLNGYTFGGGPNTFPDSTVYIPPISMMNIPNYTHTTQGQPGGAAPGFTYNNNWAYTGSLFTGGRILDHLGAFIQGTYDGIGDALSWDNTDIRYANVGQLTGKELVYGVSLNNNPTVEDVWNSTPAWGYPYVASGLAPTPAAAPLIEGGLAQQVVGVNPYIYWDRLFYAEIGGYRTLSPGQLDALGIPPPGTNSIDGIAPSWRLAIEPAWGNNTWEFGTLGLAASLVPQRMTGAGTDHVTDFGFDTQYEFLGARDSFSLQARYVTEYQNLPASEALGFATNSHNDLHSLTIKGTYFYKQTVGFTVDYFNIQGSSDPLIYGPVSLNNSPNSSGWTFELDYIPFNYGGPSFWPWLNVKFGLQFVHYNKFDGASTNYDGTGRSAAANDTLFAFAWFAF
jgi:hypothetical protein